MSTLSATNPNYPFIVRVFHGDKWRTMNIYQTGKVARQAIRNMRPSWPGAKAWMVVHAATKEIVTVSLAGASK